MIISYLKVKSATDDWIKAASDMQRLYTNNHGDYCELNEISQYSWMLKHIKELIASGELYLLSTQPSK